MPAASQKDVKDINNSTGTMFFIFFIIMFILHLITWSYIDAIDEVDNDLLLDVCRAHYPECIVVIDDTPTVSDSVETPDEEDSP